MEKIFKPDYTKYYDLFNRDKNYRDEIDFLELVFKKFCDINKKNGKAIKILDLGCGTGLHTRELIKKGYKVVGLDLSKEMTEIAKKRNPSCKFYIGDMSNFDLVKNEGKFDVIICMFSAFGYLTENSQLEGFFKSCSYHLKKNSLLILDVWNGLGVMHELPSSREKIAEVNDSNKTLKIVRKSFPNLDSKNHINNVKFIVKVFEKVDNEPEGLGNVIKNEDGEVKSSKSRLTSRNLIDTKINKNENETNNDDKNWRLITEYEENHKVRFFFPLELKKYMEDSRFKLIHLCPSFEFDKELTEKHWNMVLVGKVK